MHKGRRWDLGLVVLGAGRVIGRRSMPECMTEPEKLGQVSNLTPVLETKGFKLLTPAFRALKKYKRVH